MFRSSKVVEFLKVGYEKNYSHTLLMIWELQEILRILILIFTRRLLQNSKMQFSYLCLILGNETSCEYKNKFPTSSDKTSLINVVKSRPTHFNVLCEVTCWSSRTYHGGEKVLRNNNGISFIINVFYSEHGSWQMEHNTFILLKQLLMNVSTW